MSVQPHYEDEPAPPELWMAAVSEALRLRGIEPELVADAIMDALRMMHARKPSRSLTYGMDAWRKILTIRRGTKQ